jgi:hypothetical protein
MSAMNTLIETSKSLTPAERLSLAMGILATLQGSEAVVPAPKAKAKKAKAEPAADAEPKAKKEANWFVQALAPVRAALKPLIDAHNAALPEGGKKLAGTVAPQVGRVLKEAGQLSAEVSPTEAQIKAAFASFLASPAEPKTASVASKASGAGSKASKPKAEMTEEEAAAKRAQKAAKAKATREANKAKKAEAIVEPFTDMADGEATEIETYPWTGDVGKGVKTYERIDYNDASYIYTADGDGFIGTWDEATKTLNPTGYNIKKA